MKTFALISSALLLNAACSTAAENMCAVACECEHCSDLQQEASCEVFEAYQDVAHTYQCDDAFDAYGACYEEKGTCQAEEARFSTREPGSCTGEFDTGVDCTESDLCQNLAGDSAYCASGSCRRKVCAGSQQPCSSNDECPPGEDHCAETSDKLRRCLSDHSDVSGFKIDPPRGMQD